MRKLLAACLLSLLPACAQAAELYTCNFDSGVICSPATLSNVASHYTPNTAETLYTADPDGGGGQSGHYYTLVGTNERSPWQFNLASSGLTSIYGSEPSEVWLEWREWFDNAYCFPTSSQKMLRFGYDNASFPASKKELGLLLQSNNSDINIQYFCGLWGNSSACNVDAAIHSNQAIAKNQWVTFLIHIKLNTPGASDGQIQLWKDGVSFLSANNINMRGTDTRGYNFMWIGGNYSMLSGGTLSCSGHRYIDDVRFFDADPAATTTTTTSTATTTTTMPVGSGSGTKVTTDIHEMMMQ